MAKLVAASVVPNASIRPVGPRPHKFGSSLRGVRPFWKKGPTPRKLFKHFQQNSSPQQLCQTLLSALWGPYPTSLAHRSPRDCLQKFIRIENDRFHPISRRCRRDGGDFEGSALARDLAAARLHQRAAARGYVRGGSPLQTLFLVRFFCRLTKK